MLGKRFEILSYAICIISFECYARVRHAIYESAILLGLINNTWRKLNGYANRNIIYAVSMVKQAGISMGFFNLKMSLKSYYRYHKNCALNEGPY